MSDKKIGLEDLEEINSQNEISRKTKKKRKIKRERKSIFERFSTKENIIIFSFLLIFLIIGWNLIQKYDPFGSIKYNEVNIDTFLSDSNTVNNRDTYFILNDIILSFLYSGTSNTISANGEGSESNLHYKYSTVEYYDALTDDYKRYLSKDEYLKLANKVINNYKDNYEVLYTVQNETPIRRVYKYNGIRGDYYIVKLNASVDIYIGIELFTEDSKFKIFYLE